jgi:hypothetical protein
LIRTVEKRPRLAFQLVAYSHQNLAHLQFLKVVERAGKGGFHCGFLITAVSRDGREETEGAASRECREKAEAYLAACSPYFCDF